jgi:hypothetical protein
MLGITTPNVQEASRLLGCNLWVEQMSPLIYTNPYSRFTFSYGMSCLDHIP